MTVKDFELPDQDGNIVSLKDFPGKWIVLYFYPKDDTPGCTTEACNFRDSWHELQKRDVVILGVSKDNVKSHKKFAEKYDLNFPLLSDPDHQIIEHYGAWARKKFMGREFDGILRKTILISPDREIAKVYEDVNPSEHASQIIQDLTDLQK